MWNWIWFFWFMLHTSWTIDTTFYIHGIARRPMNHFGGFGGIHFHKAGSTTGTRDALYCVSINQSGTKSSWKACLHRNYWRQLLLEQLILRSSSQPASHQYSQCSHGQPNRLLLTVLLLPQLSETDRAMQLVMVVERLVPLKFSFRICDAGRKTIEVVLRKSVPLLCMLPWARVPLASCNKIVWQCKGTDTPRHSTTCSVVSVDWVPVSLWGRVELTSTPNIVFIRLTW